MHVSEPSKPPAPSRGAGVVYQCCRPPVLPVVGLVLPPMRGAIECASTAGASMIFGDLRAGLGADHRGRRGVLELLITEA